ncbi:hypothetical protein INR49_029500 [Caranx melampygus]|nr:hypothetical protein INR49_029500 [Caranx melampygus]
MKVEEEDVGTRKKSEAVVFPGLKRGPEVKSCKRRRRRRRWSFCVDNKVSRVVNTRYELLGILDLKPVHLSPLVGLMECGFGKPSAFTASTDAVAHVPFDMV